MARFDAKGEIFNYKFINAVESLVYSMLGVTPLPHVYYKRMKSLVLKFLLGNGRAEIAYNTLLGVADADRSVMSYE